MGRSKARPVRRKQQEEETRDRTTPARVPNWIRGYLMKSAATRLDLRHVTENGSTRVRGWDLNDERDEETTAEVLAHQVLTCAQEDAEGWGGHHRYELRAYGASASEPLGYVVFVVHADGDAEEDDGPIETATPKGQVAQAQRHAETMFRMVSNSWNEGQGHLLSVIGMLQKRNETLEARELDVMSLREKLSTNQHERDLELAREARQERFQGEIFERVAGFLPVIAARFLSKPGEKPPPMLGEDILRGILTNVVSDQNKMLAVAQILGPDDAAKLVELLKLYAAKEAEETKAKDAKANGLLTEGTKPS